MSRPVRVPTEITFAGAAGEGARGLCAAPPRLAEPTWACSATMAGTSNRFLPTAADKTNLGALRDQNRSRSAASQAGKPRGRARPRPLPRSVTGSAAGKTHMGPMHQDPSAIRLLTRSADSAPVNGNYDLPMSAIRPLGHPDATQQNHHYFCGCGAHAQCYADHAAGQPVEWLNMSAGDARVR